MKFQNSYNRIFDTVNLDLDNQAACLTEAKRVQAEARDADRFLEETESRFITAVLGMQRGLARSHGKRLCEEIVEAHITDANVTGLEVSWENWLKNPENPSSISGDYNGIRVTIAKK